MHPSQVRELEVFVVGRGLEAGPRHVGRQPHTLVPEPLRQLRSLYHLVTVYCHSSLYMIQIWKSLSPLQLMQTVISYTLSYRLSVSLTVHFSVTDRPSDCFDLISPRWVG